MSDEIGGPTANDFDVIAVNIETCKVRLMAHHLDADNAAAFTHMAVLRRGVDTEFYKTVPADMYNDGEDYTG